jgi:serine-type D-Ala-D-Ala carboxypeptidase (penicillin-binding protein 5/6)
MRFILAAIVALSSSSLSAHPQFESAAPIAYLIDMSSGAVLFEKGSNKQIPPASMAKMMTVYVAFDLVNRGKLSLDQKFTVSPATWKRWNNTGSSMFLRAGEKVSVADLLHGVATLSGNDASVVLAEGIAGSEAAFVVQMNRTAGRLGMNDSIFGTVNGWPDGNRTLTTAHDLATLGARTIHDFPNLYRQFYGFRTFRWNGISQLNRNPILGRINGADGIKTGHTDDAGYCLTGTAQQGGRRLMMVIAGLPSTESRREESMKLLNWGFTAWRAKPLYVARSVVATLPVQLGRQSHVAVLSPRALSLALPAKDSPRYKLVVRYAGPVKAPFKKGVELAQLVAKFDDGRTQVMPLVAAHSVAEAGYLGRAWNGLKSLVGA